MKTLSGNTFRLPANFVVRGGIVTFKRGDELIKIDAPNPHQSFCWIRVPDPEQLRQIEDSQKKSLNMLFVKKGKHIDIKVGDVTRIEIQQNLAID